ncbi:protein translocase subunit SecD [Streptomyces sp. JJ36]|uniref:protein translocase subunit SecD n=1 Tax=Streptomyces sp. JJ36 TaxID=2736645 RepID=UPI001F02B279|nr:protein translocase subunit SecD [Streptomyces sp. JJ36]MCF6525309.1 protein translocase subunit SecD [Streptomyces sp. JJ36]
MAAPKKGRRSPGVQGKPGRALVILLIAIVGLTAGMFASGTTTPRLGIDLAGGTSITLTAREEPGKQDAINPTNMNTAVAIIERRVNGLGVSEAEVRTQGSENIVVNIPKGTNEKQARDQVGTTAKLNFRPVLTYDAAAPQPGDGQKDGKDGKQDDSAQGQEKDEGKKDEKSDGEQAEQSAAPSGSPSPSSTTQGRAVSDALKDDPSASPSGSPDASESAPPEQDPTTPAPDTGIPADLQKKFAALNCSTDEARSKAGREAARTPPDKPTVACSLPEEDRPPLKYVLGPVAVKGKNVDDASAVFDQQRGQGWIVQMSFNDKGSDAFADITGELSRKPQPQNQFAIVLDGQVISAPSVSERLVGDAEISGSFTQQSAEDLANVLSYGALPLTFEESNVTTISPTLGAEQLKAGLIAGAIGLALVVAYLLFYYRLLGLVAIASLVVAAVLTYTIMTLLGPAIGFALSLPAICGAIVAIGITADSFIVYFERMRDEVREGRAVRSAIVRAWPHARRTIVVSDVVSIIAAVVLFIVSVGSVQGFAFVLGLTTAIDLVIVFLLTKPTMMILANRRYFAEGRPWSGLDPKRLGARPPLRGRGRRRTTSAAPKEA